MKVFRAVLSLVTSLQLVKAQSQLYRGAQEMTETGQRLSPNSRMDSNYDDEAHGIIQSNSGLSDLFVWDKPNNNKPTGTDEALILQEVSQICPKNEFFIGMHPRHRMAVWKLKEFLMEQRTPQEWRETAVDLRDREEMNPHVWLRAVLSSMVHRQDVPELGVPPMAEVIPSLFFTTEVLDAAQNSIASNSKNNSRDCVVVDESVGEDNGRENLAWYWREDIMVNSHHWYWHLAYPLEGEQGPDRGGELFYWLHHDMVARFHSERLSVGLPPMGTFDMEPGSLIPLAYNPHMHDGNSGRNWSARPINQQVSDINSEALSPGFTLMISVRNRTIQLNRVLDGIAKGSLINTDGQPIYLNSTAGLNSLGNIVEANARSENTDEYGFLGVHNDGHLIIGLVLNPRNEQGTPPGVMGDPATAMRDVIFYEYHNSINNISSRIGSRRIPHTPLFHGHDVIMTSFKVIISHFDLDIKVKDDSITCDS